MRRNYSESSFLQIWARILILIIGTQFTKSTIQMITHLNIFAFISFVDLVTPESLWRHKGVAMHVTYKTMHRFSTMRDSPPPVSELRL